MISSIRSETSSQIPNYAKLVKLLGVLELKCAVEDEIIAQGFDQIFSIGDEGLVNLGIEFSDQYNHPESLKNFRDMIFKKYISFLQIQSNQHSFHIDTLRELVKGLVYFNPYFNINTVREVFTEVSNFFKVELNADNFFILFEFWRKYSNESNAFNSLVNKLSKK